MGKGPKETNKKMQEYSRRMNGTGNGAGSKTKNAEMKITQKGMSQRIVQLKMREKFKGALLIVNA